MAVWKPLILRHYGDFGQITSPYFKQSKSAFYMIIFLFSFLKIFWLGMTTNERMNLSRYHHFSDNCGTMQTPFRWVYDFLNFQTKQTVWLLYPKVSSLLIYPLFSLELLEMKRALVKRKKNKPFSRRNLNGSKNFIPVQLHASLSSSRSDVNTPLVNNVRYIFVQHIIVNSNQKTMEDINRENGQFLVLND